MWFQIGSKKPIQQMLLIRPPGSPLSMAWPVPLSETFWAQIQEAANQGAPGIHIPLFLMGNQDLHAITPLPRNVGVRISIPIPVAGSHTIHTPFLNLRGFRYKVPPRGVVFDTSPISGKLLVTWCQCQLGQLSQHSHHQKKISQSPINHRLVGYPLVNINKKLCKIYGHVE